MTKTSTATKNPSNADDLDTSKWKKTRHPFWHIEQGSRVTGEVIDKHKDLPGKFGARSLLDVVLLRPAPVKQGKKDGKPNIVTLPAGNIVRVETRPSMGSLFNLVKVGDKVDILVTGKVPTDKGNDAWTFETAYLPGEETDEELDDDDLPM